MTSADRQRKQIELSLDFLRQRHGVLLGMPGIKSHQRANKLKRFIDVQARKVAAS